jgi:regulatory protein
MKKENSELESDRKKLLIKIRNYCANQERSLAEVKNKLSEMGFSGKEMLDVVDELKKEKFVDEQRFACAYSSGKFRINKWGKMKITAGLKSHQISESLIRVGLQEIDRREYMSVLTDILEKKALTLKKDAPQSRKNKMIRFALSKGFEYEVILEVLGDRS